MEFFIILPLGSLVPVLCFFLLCLVLGIEDAQNQLNTRVAHEFAEEHTLTVLIIIAIFCLIITAIFIHYNYKHFGRRKRAAVIPMVIYSFISSIALFLGLEHSYNVALYMVDNIAEFFGFDAIIIILLLFVYIIIAIIYLLLILLVAAPPVALNIFILYKTEDGDDRRGWFITGTILALILCIIYCYVHQYCEFDGCVTNLLKSI